MVRCKGTQRGRIAMCSACKISAYQSAESFRCDAAGDQPESVTPSRRAVLSAGAAAVVGGAAAQGLPPPARAQGAGDAELARVQGARGILLKGGVVPSLDRQVGDFAQADVLIEDGKIRELRPDIAVTGDDTAVIDAGNRIVVPGFIDSHHHFYQGLLRGI